MNKAVERTAIIPSPLFFVNILFFSQPDWYVEPDQKSTLPLVKNGKLGIQVVWSCVTLTFEEWIRVKD